MDKQMERAQLLARFKLNVKRALGQTVDLDALVRDADYARKRLAEIEEDAEDEELLVMVLRVRDLLMPVSIAPEADVPSAPAVVEPQAAPIQNAVPLRLAEEAPRETRTYLMGARSW